MKIEQSYLKQYLGSIQVKPTNEPLLETRFYSLLPITGELKEPLFLTECGTALHISNEDTLTEHYGLLVERIIDLGYRASNIDRIEK